MITKTLDVDFVHNYSFVALCETLCRLSESINNIVALSESTLLECLFYSR